MSESTLSAADPDRPEGPRTAAEALEHFEICLIEGKSPRIEDVLVDVDERERAALLRSLVALELTYRRGRGEHPTPQEYAGRFPSHETSLRDAFDEVPDTAHNLLLGAVALRLGLATGGDLVDAFASWIDDKYEPLDRMLTANRVLGDQGRALLDELVRGHLKLHGDDPRRSLKAVSLPAPVRAALEGLGEPGLRAALAHCGIHDGEGAVANKPRFRVGRRIDGGGLGDVYQAYDEELDREVALKQIRDRYASCPEHQSQLRLEAKVTGGLEHPGIVPAYASGQHDDGRPYYVMRLIRGRKFQHLIDEYHRDRREGHRVRERDPAMRKLLGYFISVCRTVAYAHHRGVLHLDLKPDNVMVREKYGETLVVDWGLTLLRDGGREGSSTAPIRPELTDGDALRPEGSSTAPIRPGPADGDDGRRKSRWGGTLRYMGPEQAAGEPDRSSDIFSLGAVLYQILTGQPPYPSARDVEGGELGLCELVKQCGYPPPRRVNLRVHPELEAICLKAMAPRPADRYADSGALADDVEHWLADQPLSCRRDPPLTWFGRWIRHHTSIVIVLVSALLIVTISWAYVQILVQEAQTKTYRGLARNTVFRLVGRIVNADLARVPQAENLRRNLANLLKEETQKALARWPDDTGLKRDAARAYLLTANLHRLNHEFSEARRDYAAARDLLKALTRRYPNRIDPFINLVQVLTEEGQVGMEGRLGPARAAQEEAKRFVERLIKDHPGEVDVQRLDALVHINLGSRQFEAEQHDLAQQSFQRAVGRLKAHQDLGLREPGWLALALLGRGEAQQKNDQALEAEKSFNEVIELLEPLAGNPDLGSDALFFLARALLCRGRLHAEDSNSRHENAAKDYNDAIAKLTQLLKRFPRAEYRLELAAAHDALGSLNRARGIPTTAVVELNAAREILNQLIMDTPGRRADGAPYDRQLAHTLAELARASESPDETVRLLRQALDEQTKAAKSSPENREDQRLKASYEDELRRVLTGGTIRP